MLHQHFLSNKKILEREIKYAELKQEDIVLEIGAGPGHLTRALSKKSKVFAVEKDIKFISELKIIKNTEVFHCDILDFFKEEHKFNKIVSNIPYYLSQEILLGLLRKEWDICVLLVQKEFGEKIFSKEKLALLVEDCCSVEIMGLVKANDFTPKGVDSVFLVLKQKKKLDERLWNFLRKIYKVKNKNAGKLENCPEKLKQKKIHQLTLEEIKEILEKNTN